MSENTPKKKQFDLIRRGEKKPTLSGTLTFIGLRTLDIPLQLYLLQPSRTGLGVRLLSSLGIRTIFTHSASPAVPSSLLLPIHSLLLSPSSPITTTASAAAQSIVLRNGGWLTTLTSTSLILFLMSIGSAAKQIYWKTVLSPDSFPAGAAVAVSAYNTIVNSSNSLLFLALGTTSLVSWPRVSFNLFSLSSSSTGADVGPATSLTLPLSTVVGTVMYVVGMTIETHAERQRMRFKRKPENRGKVCMVGLWRWARHVNYFGYALWRGGYCMVGAGWAGGLVMGLWQGWDLGTRAVAVQDEYCSDRYGKQWVQFKREVPYRIVPGLY